MDKTKYDELVDWCRVKLGQLQKRYLSDRYKQGYEDAMHAVMSKLHDEKEKNNGN